MGFNSAFKRLISVHTITTNYSENNTHFKKLRRVNTIFKVLTAVLIILLLPCHYFTQSLPQIRHLKWCETKFSVCSLLMSNHILCYQSLCHDFWCQTISCVISHCVTTFDVKPYPVLSATVSRLLKFASPCIIIHLPAQTTNNSTANTTLQR